MTIRLNFRSFEGTIFVVATHLLCGWLTAQEFSNFLWKETLPSPELTITYCPTIIVVGRIADFDDAIKELPGYPGGNGNKLGLRYSNLILTDIIYADPIVITQSQFLEFSRRQNDAQEVRLTVAHVVRWSDQLQRWYGSSVEQGTSQIFVLEYSPLTDRFLIFPANQTQDVDLIRRAVQKRIELLESWGMGALERLRKFRP